MREKELHKKYENALIMTLRLCTMGEVNDLSRFFDVMAINGCDLSFVINCRKFSLNYLYKVFEDKDMISKYICSAYISKEHESNQIIDRKIIYECIIPYLEKYV